MRELIGLALLVCLVLLGLAFGRAVGARLGLDDVDGESDLLTSDPKEGSDPDAVAPIGNWSLEEAKSFEEFALFWVGNEYRGIPLTAIIRADHVTYERPGMRAYEDSVSFLYGSCVPPAGGDGGCPAPYQVMVEHGCQVQPGLSDPSVNLGEPYDFNGATAQMYTDSHLQFWTQDVAVTVFGPDAESMQDLASDVMPLNSKASLASGGKFQPPASVDDLGCDPLSPARRVEEAHPD